MYDVLPDRLNLITIGGYSIKRSDQIWEEMIIDQYLLQYKYWDRDVAKKVRILSGTIYAPQNFHFLN